MIKQKFIIHNKNIEGVEKEETINIMNFNYDSIDLKVLITKQKTNSNGKNYYNVYIIDKVFKKDPFNCLKEQIPMNIVKNEDKYFNRMFCEMKALERYLWLMYGTNNENILSFVIEVLKD